MRENFRNYCITTVTNMTRFWFEFNLENYDKPPMGIIVGCGITASTEDEVIDLMKRHVFKDKKIPPFMKVIKNIDISTLDKNHVIPNMKSPSEKGIWFPLGYSR